MKDIFKTCGKSVINERECVSETEKEKAFILGTIATHLVKPSRQHLVYVERQESHDQGEHQH